VIDDEVAILQFLEQLLTGEGHEVETVENADRALAAMKGSSYDMLLLDIKLPGVSGTQLYQKIKKLYPQLASKVVFITGDVMGAETKGFLTRTRARFITKPFNTEQLLKELNQVLAG